MIGTLPKIGSRPAFVGGSQVTATEWIEVRDPGTGEVVATVPDCGPSEVDAAVASARATYDGGWRLTSAADRGRVLRRIADGIRADREELARLESLDTGKPMRQAYMDVDFAARYFEYNGSIVEAVFGNILPTGSDQFALTLREPYGVTGHIIPWNYPLGLGARTIAPALAAGNCCVMKPAEDAPLSSIRLAELTLAAGLPAGAFNVVTGTGAGAGAALAGHPGIGFLSFTGSVPVGRIVGRTALENLTPTTLELGGKSPNIVLADADLDRATPILAQAILQNAGQTCSAGSRVLADDRVHDELVARLAAVFEATTIGHGSTDPDLGPVISQKQLERVLGLIDVGRTEADLVTGGGVPQDRELPAGYYVRPTLFDDVDPGARIAQEEIFGPVLAVTRFQSLDEAVQIANGTEYGLVAGVWTRNLVTAHRLIRDLDCGQVLVNTFANGVELPFSGRRNSGFGVEKGFEGLLAFTQLKGVIVGPDGAR